MAAIAIFGGPLLGVNRYGLLLNRQDCRPPQAFIPKTGLRLHKFIRVFWLGGANEFDSPTYRVRLYSPLGYGIQLEEHTLTWFSHCGSRNNYLYSGPYSL